MLKYTEGDVKVNGVNIHYYRSGGNKPPIILLHGATDNGLCWLPLAEWFSDRYDVIMPDALGHGKSDRLTPGFKFTDHAAQMAGLISELKINQPIIMGHSMGAGMTVNIAVNYPDLPKAIILEDPAWMDFDPAQMPPETQKQREEVIKTNAAYRTKSREQILAEGRQAHPRWSEAELIPWSLSKTQFDPMLSRYLNLAEPSYTELVPRMNRPTLLLIAEGGIVKPTTAENAARLWKSKYPFKWVRFMDAGHNIRREQFEKYKTVVSQFLTGL